MPLKDQPCIFLVCMFQVTLETNKSIHHAVKYAVAYIQATN